MTHAIMQEQKGSLDGGAPLGRSIGKRTSDRSNGTHEEPIEARAGGTGTAPACLPLWRVSVYMAGTTCSAGIPVGQPHLGARVIETFSMCARPTSAQESACRYLVARYRRRACTRVLALGVYGHAQDVAPG